MQISGVCPASLAKLLSEEKHSIRTQITGKSVAEVNTLEAHTYVNVDYI